MAKSKSRSARKKLRTSAVRATERGLPAASLQTRAELTNRALTRSGPERAGARRAADASHGASGGMPTILKVALGAAVALGLVYAASLLRKSQGNHSSTFEVKPGSSQSDAHSPDQETPDRSRTTPSETTGNDGSDRSTPGAP